MRRPLLFVLLTALIGADERPSAVPAGGASANSAALPNRAEGATASARPAAGPAAAVAESPVGNRAKSIGFDAGFVLEMESKGLRWSRGGRERDPYALLREAGGDSARIRLWTGDDGPSGLDQALRAARRAQDAGLKPHLVVFLSEGWADMVKQPAPALWRGLSSEKRLAAIEAYAERVTARFRAAGIRVEHYEIGNEIDFGVSGVFEEEWPKRVSLEYMSQRIWPEMAPLLLAAQRGVRRADPKARFCLHLARWDEPEYAVRFWRFMESRGVAVDVPGVSYFPTSSARESDRPLARFREHARRMHAALGRPILVCEFAHPASPSFPGQFAEWNKPVPGYPLDEAGQRRWVSDFLNLVRAEPALAGAIYWSPEWYRSGMWEAFALFDEQGRSRPALEAFRQQDGE